MQFQTGFVSRTKQQLAIGSCKIAWIVYRFRYSSCLLAGMVPVQLPDEECSFRPVFYPGQNSN